MHARSAPKFGTLPPWTTWFTSNVLVVCTFHLISRKQARWHEKAISEWEGFGWWSISTKKAQSAGSSSKMMGLSLLTKDWSSPWRSARRWRVLVKIRKNSHSSEKRAAAGQTAFWCARTWPRNIIKGRNREEGTPRSKKSKNEQINSVWCVRHLCVSLIHFVEICIYFLLRWVGQDRQQTVSQWLNRRSLTGQFVSFPLFLWRQMLNNQSWWHNNSNNTRIPGNNTKKKLRSQSTNETLHPSISICLNAPKLDLLRLHPHNINTRNYTVKQNDGSVSKNNQ